MFLWLWLALVLCSILGASPAWPNQCWFGAGWSIHGETDVDAVRRERLARFTHWVYPSSFGRGRPTFPRCPNGPNPPYRIFGHNEVRAALYARDWCHGMLGTKVLNLNPDRSILLFPTWLNIWFTRDATLSFCFWVISPLQFSALSWNQLRHDFDDMPYFGWWWCTVWTSWWSQVGFQQNSNFQTVFFQSEKNMSLLLAGESKTSSSPWIWSWKTSACASIAPIFMATGTLVILAYFFGIFSIFPIFTNMLLFVSLPFVCWSPSV